MELSYVMRPLPRFEARGRKGGEDARRPPTQEETPYRQYEANLLCVSQSPGDTGERSLRKSARGSRAEDGMMGIPSGSLCGPSPGDKSIRQVLNERSAAGSPQIRNGEHARVGASRREGGRVRARDAMSAEHSDPVFTPKNCGVDVAYELLKMDIGHRVGRNGPDLPDIEHRWVFALM